ncbi:hypothetical protein BBBOND_0307380 [Babesia bigemina]|uniref:Uncharacterized protein n=1 Tax=Babesia bigemina TaxID=5866 RepID=A0A061DCR3_BABBI|nr:hypothetical protein BBBOND_0307380 [Babesia bigemina]CDR96834.1 hypothetical protein BBBOND_0307380 [Babesia bigemina]|eukprot:XP_012769020.1 hypothetical protein BBBOND_0307380 [Babesia bigemina]
MKASVGAIFRVLLFVLFAIALHVRANKRSWSVEKSRKRKYSEHGEYSTPEVEFYVKMKPINAPKKIRLRKPPSTYTAIGSNNIYYPWLPTVSNMGAAIPL